MSADHHVQAEHGDVPGLQSGNSPNKQPSVFLWALPTKLSLGIGRGALSAIADQLQDQADYVKQLARIDAPAEALACHQEFARKSVTRWFDEGLKALEHSLSLAKPDK